MEDDMARYRSDDYSQTMLLPVNFPAQIIPGTYEHAIHLIVEERLDLTDIENRYCNDETGAPAYDPRRRRLRWHVSAQFCPA